MDYLIACYGLKGDLSPVMLNKIFHDSFENLKLQGFVWKNNAIASFEIYG